MKRKKYNDLKKELGDQLNNIRRVKEEINERCDFLFKKYSEEVFLSDTHLSELKYKFNNEVDINLLYKLSYIKEVEDYLENNNKIKQLSIFDK
jgi:hypothetical protein